jgi:hypothetical protein
VGVRTWPDCEIALGGSVQGDPVTGRTVESDQAGKPTASKGKVRQPGRIRMPHSEIDDVATPNA